jgi:hypothetical protein
MTTDLETLDHWIEELDAAQEGLDGAEFALEDLAGDDDEERRLLAAALRDVRGASATIGGLAETLHQAWLDQQRRECP